MRLDPSIETAQPELWQHLQGAYRMRILRNNPVVNLIPSRDKKTAANYSLDHREDVQYVAMDMRTPYRDAVQAV